MIRKIVTVLSISMLLASCMWKTDEKKVAEEKESPVISSLKDANVPCFKCHAYEKYAVNEPGRFSHEKHVKAGAHCNQCHIIKEHTASTVIKEACNSCHKLSNFTYTGSGMPVTFTHQNHAKKFSCGECHPALFQPKKGSTRMTMDEMYKGGTCGKCHNGKAAFASTACARCHTMKEFKKELSYKSEGMSPAVFSHEMHTAMFECKNCHTALFPYKFRGSGMKMDDLYQGKFCGSCHNGQAAFASQECQRCHK